MSKNKRRPIKRFCETCQKRTIFNMNRVEDLICSRCGSVFRDEEKKEPKVQDENKKAKHLNNINYNNYYASP